MKSANLQQFSIYRDNFIIIIILCINYSFKLIRKTRQKIKQNLCLTPQNYIYRKYCNDITVRLNDIIIQRCSVSHCVHEITDIANIKKNLNV